MIDYVIMDITCGDLVGGVYEIWEEANKWIENQEFPQNYEIIER